MVTIPNLNWDKQTNTPSESEFEENSQLVGCIGCAIEETEAPEPPPGTIFMFRGGSFCITHLIQEKEKIRRYGIHDRQVHSGP